MVIAIKSLSIYIHIPFCKKKCVYCDFISFSGCEHLFESYTDSLIREIKYVGENCENYTINTIFIGGGTPSVLPPILIRKILLELKKIFNVSASAEVSIEANPGTLSFEFLQCLNDLGVNRISLGLQSSKNNLLQKLGRIHTFEQFEESFAMAYQSGLSNINVDLMFGLPFQTIIDWEDTLDAVIALNPSHISAYSLTIEENTVMGKNYKNGEISLPDDDTDRLFYYMVKRKLKDAGFMHYEISNFAKEGMECRHNLVYWNCNEYIGLGLGAHSFLNSYRFNNTYDLNKYISLKGNPTLITENRLFISHKDKYCEFMFMGLRLIGGVDEDVFKARFNISVDSVFGEELNKLENLNLIQRSNKKIFLTGKGLDLSNIVFMEFI